MAVGPNKLVKFFAYEPGPIIQEISNQSLKEGYIVSLLKSSIVTPIPKVTCPRKIIRDLETQLDGKVYLRQYERRCAFDKGALLFNVTSHLRGDR